MFVPVTVKTSAGLPAATEVWEIVPIMGSASAVEGVENVNGDEPEVPSEFVTVTAAVPGNADCVPEIWVVICVGVTNFVGCSTPFQFTTESLVKFVPFTVSVKPCALQ